MGRFIGAKPETDDGSASSSRRREERQRSPKNTKSDHSVRQRDPSAKPAVKVKKNDRGFEVLINGSRHRYNFPVVSSEVSAITKDLETAIEVIRRDQ